MNFLIIVTLALLSSCNAKTHNTRPEMFEAKVEPLLNPFFDQGVCQYNNQLFKNCEMIKERIQYASENNKSINKRFMIIDTRFYPYSFFIRHQDKVLGIFRHNPEGLYQKESPMVKYPKILNDYKEELSQKNDIFFHQNRIEFKALQNQINIYHDDEPDYPYNHGETIFDVIVEKNPEAQVILTEYPRPRRSIICNDQNNFNSLKLFLNNSVKTLSREIQFHDINYVNLAVGKSFEWAKGMLSMGCSGKNYSKEKIYKLLEVYSGFHQNLVDTNPNTLFIQSVENQELSIAKTPRNFPTSCLKGENVIQTSYVNHLEKVYSRDGQKPEEGDLNSGGPKDLKNCIDIYINGRAEERAFFPWLAKHDYSGMDVFTNFQEIEQLRQKHKVKAWYDSTTFYYLRNFEKRPEIMMSSSWATAVTGSFINYLVQQEGFSPKNLKDYFQGRIFDPLFHNQFVRNHHE